MYYPGEKARMEDYVRENAPENAPAEAPSCVDPRLTRSLRLADGVMGRQIAVLVGEIADLVA